jgi:hypothetical protein
MFLLASEQEETMYFFIRNKGTMHRRLMEVVGYSAKRDAPASAGKIGHKGSGKKLSAIAGLRAGIQTFVASSDEEGSYLLNLETAPMRMGAADVERVRIRYRSTDHSGKTAVTEYVNTSWSLDAFTDWDSPIGKKLFKILREHVIDAWDEDRGFTWGVCEEPAYAQEGETVVYLTYDPEFEEMMAAPERYFKFLSKEPPLASFEAIGAIWKKSEPGVTRAFPQGVLGECARHYWQSAFDYSVNRRDLFNEDRSLKSQQLFSAQVGAMLGLLEDAAICETVLRAIDDGIAELETQALTFALPVLSDESKRAWKQAADSVFGKNAALAADDERLNSDAVNAFGRKLLRPTNVTVGAFLKEIGMAHAATLKPVPSDRPFQAVAFYSLDADSRQRFFTAYGIFAMLFPERAGKYAAYFYRALNREMEVITGFSGYGKGKFRQLWIKLKKDGTLPDVTTLLMILIHESRHCATRLGDYDIGFVHAAEMDIIELGHRLVLAKIEGEDVELVQPIIGDADDPEAVVPDFGHDLKPGDVPDGGLFGA